MSSYHCLIRVVYIFRDEVAYLIFTLPEDTSITNSQMIGRSVFVASHLFILLLLFCSGALRLGIPGIPVRRVVHLIGQHITRVVTHVVRRAVDEVEVYHLLLLHMVDSRVSSFQVRIFCRQHHRTGRNDACVLAAVLAVSSGDVGLVYKQCFL